MTLAEFTAENMPENSVSKSGVCKGPKYFSYKGVTLYKLKNSFLKNKE
ncbi:unknown [Alistipes sp. CAG:514]|nr:unknown [Alistipes sp. CAG:514]